MTQPYVGLPTDDGGCAFALDLDDQPCGQPSTTHVMVHSVAWGFVALESCGAHVGIARRSGDVMAEHPYRPDCATTDCWHLTGGTP